MTVIDKILNEWSFRCHDGIVDLNDRNKVKILFEILKEDIDDDILNALISTDAPTKEKILKYLRRIGDTNSNENLEQQVATLLKPKLGRNGLIEQVIFIADSKQFDVLEELKSYLENPTIGYSDLIENDNLDTLFAPTNFPKEFIDKIITIKGSAQPSLGMGEVALCVFLKNTFKSNKGDVVSDGNLIEIKGSNAKIMDSEISVGSKSEISDNPKFQNIVQKYSTDTLGKNTTWVEYIQTTYNNTSNKKQYVDDLNNFLRDLYPKTNISVSDADLKTIDLFNKKIAVSIAKDYLKDQNLLIFNSATKNYIYIEGYEEYVNKIYDGTIFAARASDKVPRISY
jgi:hypothetical protein